MLTTDERRTLLALARASIHSQVAGWTSVELTPHDWPDASGVFVTIKRGGHLRGCLGTLQNRSGLAAEVARCAADSATADPRFPPVAGEELPELVRGVDRIEAKLEDLETLYDVVHDEIEGTALDLATALRSLRQGNGMLGRVKRILVPSR